MSPPGELLELLKSQREFLCKCRPFIYWWKEAEHKQELWNFFILNPFKVQTSSSSVMNQKAHPGSSFCFATSSSFQPKGLWGNQSLCRPEWRQRLHPPGLSFLTLGPRWHSPTPMCFTTEQLCKLKALSLYFPLSFQVQNFKLNPGSSDLRQCSC